ncbi:MAG: TIGR04283 family arsenosugar biosynthesis glycosyltransferase [Parvularculaceae bacterium]
MISVVIPTLDAAVHLPATLDALVPAAVDGLVKEVVIADGGSADATLAVAEDAGACVVAAPKSRGAQLKAGAEAARSAWLLFLHADTKLSPAWIEAARAFIESGDDRAATFTLRFDAQGLRPSLVVAGAMLRTRLFTAPYGDQGLLISRRLYDDIGGFRDMPLFEDVDIVRRLVRKKGRRALCALKAQAVTSAERYARDGYVRRVLKNAWCLALYKAGVAPERIMKVYRS